MTAAAGLPPQPDWVAVLREACQRQTQVTVSRRLGYSASVVSSVLKGSYRGDLGAVERAVRGALMAATVVCPILGELAMDVCAREQRKPFTATNALRVRLWRACRAGCPHSRLTKEDHDALP